MKHSVSRNRKAPRADDFGKGRDRTRSFGAKQRTVAMKQARSRKAADRNGLDR